MDDEKERRTKGKKEIPAGITLQPEPFSTEGKPLGSYREAYWEDVMRRRSELEAARSGLTSADELPS